MNTCNAIWVQAPACPFSQKVNGRHTSTHRCNKTVEINVELRRVVHTDGGRQCECRCGAKN